MSRLLEALAQATQEDLTAVEKRLAEIEQEADALKAACGLLRKKFGAEAAPAAPAVAREAAVRGPAVGSTSDQIRVQLASGPKSAEEIAAATGLSLHGVRITLGKIDGARRLDDGRYTLAPFAKRSDADAILEYLARHSSPQKPLTIATDLGIDTRKVLDIVGNDKRFVREPEAFAAAKGASR